jgi:anthranilate synthase component II
MILLIDNYDSFVHNLARYFQRLGQDTLVRRNDAVTPQEIRALAPAAVVLSPGPCAPNEAGYSMNIVQQLHRQTPMLGVCLGHQAIAAALGARIIRAPEPRHGRTSPVEHAATGLFAGLPSPLTVCRYHSLVIDEPTLPPELRVTARAPGGEIMAIEHVAASVFGIQFHPEAALTEHGYKLLSNFLRLAGCDAPDEVQQLAASELRQHREPTFTAPARPLTF